MNVRNLIIPFAGSLGELWGAYSGLDSHVKAPFPYFGGKSAAAKLIWHRLLGHCDPFSVPIVTINDFDCMVANFWRAVQHDPEAVADHCNYPVNEVDLHSRHRWLVGVEWPEPEIPEAFQSPDLRAAYLAGYGSRGSGSIIRAFRERMRTDPDYFDAKIAGWWCWGACMWIGSGWCIAPSEKLPHISDCTGRGVHGAPSEKRPHLNGGRRGDESYAGLGVHGERPSEWKQIPQLSNGGLGVHAVHPEGRPQLGDAFSRGRGIHGNDAAETCRERGEWLVGWFRRLQDRLRTVRVCCGDFERVCDSTSTLTRLGITAVLLDPPYDADTGRAMGLYGEDCGEVSKRVRAWCERWGDHSDIRIALCGLAGEHDVLEAVGWDVVEWKSGGGYANRGKADGDDEHRRRERIWFSPSCVAEPGLFQKIS